MRPTYRLGGYAEWTPPTELAHVLERSWSFAAGGEHRVLPHSGVSLFLNGRLDARGRFLAEDLVVQGSAVTCRFFRPDPGDVLVSVRLRAEWCRAVLGVDPEAILDRIVSVGHTGRWHGTFARLRRADDAEVARSMLLAFVRDRLADVRSASTAGVAHRALEQLRGAVSDPLIWRIARSRGLSERTLRRVVGAATALRPKWIQRIERLNRTVAAADGSERPSWSRLAHRFGYSDQAHLTREVRAFAGCTPVELHRERRAQNGG